MNTEIETKYNDLLSLFNEAMVAWRNDIDSRSSEKVDSNETERTFIGVIDGGSILNNTLTIDFTTPHGDVPFPNPLKGLYIGQKVKVTFDE